MSFPARFSRTQTPHVLQSSFDLKDSAEDNSDNLFESLNNNNNNSNSNNSSNQDEDEEEAREQGREQSDTIIHLNKPSGPPSSALPRFSFLSAPTAPVPAAATAQAPGHSFALLADKTSKRVRVTDPAISSSSSSQNNNSRRLSRGSSPILLDVDTDYTPATSSPSKRVRFDESRNQIHWHHRSSSISPSGSPPAINLKAQPSASALLRRSSSYQQSPSSSFDFDESFTSVSSSSSNTGHLSPEKFTMSLENTSQDVLDFASSLTRLMGGGASILGSQDSDTSSTSTSNPISNSFAFNSPMLPSSASSRIFSSMFQASPPSPVRPSFMSYSPPPSSSLSSCWSPTINDDEDEDDSMETAQRISPPPPPVSVQKKSRAPFVPRRPRNTGNLSPTRPGGVAPAVPRRFPSMLKREASNASFLDNYPASLAPEADENDRPFPFPVTRISPPPPAAATATVATVTVPIVPRMLTPPREASVSPVLPSSLAFSSFNTTPTPVSLSLLSSSATNTTPLLRKSISDIPLRALNNITNKHNESNNNLWLDAQKIVPKFKKSASFNELMDSPSSISKITLSQEDVIMTLAPLFPLQASSSSPAVPNSLKML